MIVEQKNAVPPDGAKSAPIPLVVDYDGADDLVLDYDENLSTGRVFLNTARLLQVGTLVQLTLVFPGLLEPIAISGAVSWTREDEEGRGIGIELEDGAARDRLQELVSRIRRRDPGVVKRLVRVLVVEDNPHVAQLIRNGLRGSGRRDFQDLAFNFRTATDGRHALELLRTESFDLLIVDLYLPIMDGVHVIESVRADERLCHVPIIAVSAGGTSARESAMAAGADIFLEKPMRLRQIIDAMSGLIDLRA